MSIPLILAIVASMLQIAVITLILRMRGWGDLKRSALIAIAAFVAMAIVSGCVSTVAASFLFFGGIASNSEQDFQAILTLSAPLFVIALLTVPFVHGVIFRLFRLTGSGRIVPTAIWTTLATLLIAAIVVGALYLFANYAR